MLLLGVLNTEAEEEDTERMVESLGRRDCSARWWDGIRRGRDMYRGEVR